MLTGLKALRGGKPPGTRQMVLHPGMVSRLICIPRSSTINTTSHMERDTAQIENEIKSKCNANIFFVGDVVFIGNKTNPVCIILNCIFFKLD